MEDMKKPGEGEKCPPGRRVSNSDVHFDKVFLGVLLARVYIGARVITSCGHGSDMGIAMMGSFSSVTTK